MACRHVRVGSNGNKNHHCLERLLEGPSQNEDERPKLDRASLSSGLLGYIEQPKADTGISKTGDLTPRRSRLSRQNF